MSSEIENLKQQLKNLTYNYHQEGLYTTTVIKERDEARAQLEELKKCDKTQELLEARMQIVDLRGKLDEFNNPVDQEDVEEEIEALLERSEEPDFELPNHHTRESIIINMLIESTIMFKTGQAITTSTILDLNQRVEEQENLLHAIKVKEGLDKEFNDRVFKDFEVGSTKLFAKNEKLKRKLYELRQSTANERNIREMEELQVKKRKLIVLDD